MLKIVFFTTWLPRRCGIATFAYDLTKAIDKVSQGIIWQVIALDDPGSTTKYDSKVIFKIDRTNPKDYIRAAHYINQSDLDLVIIHHEFNLYGKHGGGRILFFLRKLKKPSVIVFHSIPHPSDRHYPEKKKKIQIAQKIAHYVNKIVVFCPSARQRLIDIYQIEPRKIVVIPHGSPYFPRANTTAIKKKLGFNPHDIILLNFGFVRPRKNLELIIQAMPEVVKMFPQVKLLIVGTGGSHPQAHIELKRYITQLKKIIKKLNIEKNIIFITRFLPYKEMVEFYQAADVFVYANRYSSQLSSGPLTYALVAGKAVVTTFFRYAYDILNKNRGIIVPIRNSEALAGAVCKILSDHKLKKRLEKNAYNLGRNLLWEEVSKDYIQLFNLILNKK